MSTASLEHFQPRRILVLQQRKIGDVLLATPSIRLLKKRYPHTPVDVFTEDLNAQVLENNPDIDTLFRLDKRRLKNVFQALAFYRQAGKKHDLVVDFQQLPRCRLVTALSLARVRLTFTPPWYNRAYYSHWVDTLDGYAAMSKASVLRPLGIQWNGEPPRLFLTAEERTWAAEYLRSQGLDTGDVLITVDVTQNGPMRKWPEEHYARLLALALDARPRLKLFLLYGPGEAGQAQNVARLAGLGKRLLVPEEVLDLRRMAAVMDQAALHLGNCSAPRHFAAALDLPSLIILGSTSPAWRYPSPLHLDVSLGLDCQPCNLEKCPYGARCLRELTPEIVLPRLLEHLEAHGRLRRTAEAG